MHTLLIAVLLVASESGTGLTRFRPIDKMAIPRSLIEEVCPLDFRPCWEDFLQYGGAWVGDVNNDGVDELLLSLSNVIWPVSEGDLHRLYERRSGAWVAIDGAGWQAGGRKLGMLPPVRAGYHDLRIGISLCLKWNGSQYVPYAAEDYRQLPPELFDKSNTLEAYIFWLIRYAGLKTFRFEPQWFPFDWSEEEADDVLDDPQYNLRWAAFYKAGVWGIRNNQAFLLVPRVGYVGPDRFELRDDWLLIYSDVHPENPAVRYNRRTGELRIEEERD